MAAECDLHRSQSPTEAGRGRVCVCVYAHVQGNKWYACVCARECIDTVEPGLEEECEGHGPASRHRAKPWLGL